MRAVDLFAGAGGWSTAAVRCGIEVVEAVNHWPTAVATHQANHPTTRHTCASLHGYDPRRVSPAPDLVLASPSCTGHTRARGRERAHHDEARATAHAVTDLVDAWRPDWLVVENVAEFLLWDRYPAWRMDLECMGYRIAHTVLCAADFGYAARRRRVYIAATRTSAPIRLPVQPLFSPRRAVAEVIDWSDPGEPIEGRFGATTLAQIEAGRVAHGRRFLCPYYGSQRAEARTDPVDRPCGAVTTHDRYLVINGDHARFLSIPELLSLQGFPPDYLLCGTRADQIKQIGNAVHVGMGERVLKEIFSQVRDTA
ncbi:MAG: DNA cytosine methyltransferase [Rhodobacteraceae bacterium]|jgi:DNA (cytosine-5)-methyltransferase 1|nr:DNA cytosine methyltransferase [Paracoccaceae bacterium]